MGICWYCHWGWPEPVAAIYKKALKQLDGNDSPLHFGPSHIVWEDENFDRAEWCLEHFDDYRGDYSDEELAIVRSSLEELASLSLSVRCPEPEDYNGENPDLFPPADGIEMTTRADIRAGQRRLTLDLDRIVGRQDELRSSSGDIRRKSK